MAQKNPKIFIYFFLIIFIFQIISLLFLLLAPTKILAADSLKIKPQVSIGDFKQGVEKEITPNSIGEYIKAIYKYAIGVVGILAAVVMMFGGLRWIVAGGNASAIGEAKAWIGAALAGLILAMLSYTILKTINPDLVNFKPVNITKIGNMKNCCSEKSGPFPGFSTTTNNQQIFSCTPKTKNQKSLGKIWSIDTKKEKCVLQQNGKYKPEVYGCCTITIPAVSCKKSLKDECKGTYVESPCEDIQKCPQYLPST